MLSKSERWKFIQILSYQDHLSKFVQLRPMESKRAEEVAKNLIDIFCIFGAPAILQSDNGREFTARVIEECVSLWPGLKTVHGQPRHSQSQVSRVTFLLQYTAIERFRANISFPFHVSI